MKKTLLLTLFLLILISGCASPTAPETQPSENMMQIGNPWKGYDSIESAEAASGLVFPLPVSVGSQYTAESFRVMNGELMEVIYCAGEFEVIVRMQAGEDLDLSGVYETFSTIQTEEINGVKVTVQQTDTSFLHLISKDGYSYSIYAPDGYPEETSKDFLAFLL